MSCSAKNCTLNKRLNPGETSFHWFPRDNNLCKQWMTALQLRENWKVTPYKYVCGKHFQDTDYRTKKRKLLKPNVVPSLLLGNKIKQESSCTASDYSELSAITDNRREEVIIIFESNILENTCQNIKAINFLGKPLKQDGALSLLLDTPLKKSSSFSATDYSESSIEKLYSASKISYKSRSPFHCPPVATSKLSIKNISLEGKSVSGIADVDTSNHRSSEKRRLKKLRQQYSGYKRYKYYPSTDGSTKRKRIGAQRFNYSVSPSTINRESQLLTQVNLKYRKRLYKARQKIKSLEAQVTSMRTTMKIVSDFLNKENLISEDALLHLRKTYAMCKIRKKKTLSDFTEV